MKISVIIPTYHRNEDLAHCLNCLSPKIQTISSDYEVIVTDDGSNSTSENLIHENYPWVKWVQGPRRGPAANRNHGAKFAKGEWLVFTDDDCLPTPQWLAGFPFNTTKVNVLEGLTKANRKQSTFAEESPINLTGGYLWSCNFAIRKDLFQRLHGFDENFPYAAMEDPDLRERIKCKKEEIAFCNDAIVIHPWRPRKGKPHWENQHKSTLYFFSKHSHLKPKYLWLYYMNIATRASTINIFKNKDVKYLKGASFNIRHSIWLYKKSILYFFKKPI